jgi:regulatory protein
VKDRALRLLGVRERSREELRRRLARAGYHPSEIEPVIDGLEASGLVDDERFAKELATHEVGRRRLGRRGAVASLRRYGIAPEMAEQAVDDLGADDEQSAVALARQRLPRLAALDPNVAKRRLLAFLQRRGYDGGTSWAAVRQVLGEGEEAS